MGATVERNRTPEYGNRQLAGDLMGMGVDGISWHFERGYIAFDGMGPNSRDRQVFIAAEWCSARQRHLDKQTV